MKILMISSEATPFAKSGGLADAVSSLSKALAARGNDVRVVIPRYYCVDRDALRKHEAPLGVPMGGGEGWCAVYEARLPGSEVPIYFIDHEGLYGRDGLYGPRLDAEWEDNDYRFAFLCKAAFQLCRYLGWIPDILHSHDWQAALVPVYLKAEEASRGFEGSASVITIHNLGYQGSYPGGGAARTGLSEQAMRSSLFLEGGQVNFLKAGLSTADFLTTVSPTYAREIQGPEQGFFLDGIVRMRSGDLMGILNGIDLAEWDPSSDPLIPLNYGPGSLARKESLKRELLASFGLPYEEGRPVVSMVTRLAAQKGIGELFAPGYGCAGHMAQDFHASFLVLGSGEKWCERELSELSARFPNFRAKIGYDNALAHLIEAGSDFFLMPSRYEPCGLNQLYSLRYGTLPIVRRTGGLADTVSNYDGKGGGTGFLFDDLTPKAIYDTTAWALDVYRRNPAHIEAMRKRGMEGDYSWDRSARLYEEAYARALEKRGKKPAAKTATKRRKP
jgi:starch synthase